MNVFAKIFSQIFDSSISADYVVRHIFMDLLVLADRDGVIDMTLDAISRRTNVPQEAVAHAISELSKPDRASRCHVEDGRRLVPIDSHRDWGWQIVNYEHYRNIRDEEARRTYFRDKQREHRAKSVKCVKSVKDSQSVSIKITQGEGDTELEEEKDKRLLLPAVFRLPAAGGKEYPVSVEQIDKWVKLFPAVDVLQALRAMIAWLEASPQRRKTVTGMPRFIVSWLTREQDKPQRNGGSNGTHNASSAKQRVDSNRRAITETLAARGIHGPWDTPQPDREAVSEPRFDRRDAGVHERSGADSAEILPPER